MAVGAGSLDRVVVAAGRFVDGGGGGTEEAGGRSRCGCSEMERAGVDGADMIHMAHEVLPYGKRERGKKGAVLREKCA